METKTQARQAQQSPIQQQSSKDQQQLAWNQQSSSSTTSASNSFYFNTKSNPIDFSTSVLGTKDNGKAAPHKIFTKLKLTFVKKRKRNYN